MIMIKISLFLLTVFTVRYIFILINNIGDKKIIKMKELIEFTEYLRIYSCDLKMSFEEILDKFNFKSKVVKIICYRLLEEMKKQENKSKKNFLTFVENSTTTPMEFNYYFAEIIDYYGNTFSDILDKKLSIASREMEIIMKEYESIHKEKKNLYNKISILVGCLTAIILV
ncbi:hypothetical protein [Sedimentibacter sp. MB31-C6]|uniref:hypothetical protein n=1 Tax=Sedimentibacter sp. MB31-C6 TaxID=3109366 RepID=UPI002DDD14DB|nr:hypothetical protein [Sedimentibacter sp. MB36-C1]WSI04180.1 hypothetical protein U8307_14440 [Sedimentibacter sp. MB36-C1]